MFRLLERAGSEAGKRPLRVEAVLPVPHLRPPSVDFRSTVPQPSARKLWWNWNFRPEPNPLDRPFEIR